MAVTLAIDPVTRIEGHLKAKLDVSDGVVQDAWLTGGMFRGFSVFVRKRTALSLRDNAVLNHFRYVIG